MMACFSRSFQASVLNSGRGGRVTLYFIVITSFGIEGPGYLAFNTFYVDRFFNDSIGAEKACKHLINI
ncbi:MAG: hypothetical protein JL50_19890 [Peptococcaceae bacterium BICA1-7]|nr:MAG: hypothetical protein JL50_19890 [Peptococcaceae bacterium BICA1-7]HBV98340.1 hypothetical protein [Desulfotomaculum sp.]